MRATKRVVLSWGEGKSVAFSIMLGTMGADVVDIRPMYARLGMLT